MTVCARVHNNVQGVRRRRRRRFETILSCAMISASCLLHRPVLVRRAKYFRHLSELLFIIRKTIYKYYILIDKPNLT